MANETSDKVELAQIFPIEVWELVLEKVDASNTYQKIGNASTHLRTLLESRATQILFPEVISIMVNCKGHDWLPLIHARQVCRTWKNGIDRLLQRQEYFRQQEDEMLFFMTGMTFADSICVDFESADQFLKFEKYFDSTYLGRDVNPFISRKVFLTFAEYNDDGEELDLKAYYRSCLHFLEKYGTNIWHCIVVEDLEDSPVGKKFYKKWLHKILQLMPNLRSYELHASNFEDAVHKCRKSVNLCYLEYLCLAGMPAPVAKAMIETNPQLQYLDTSLNTRLIPTALQLLNDLKELRVAPMKGEIDVFSGDRIENRVQCVWLDVGHEDTIAWRQAFRVLECHFAQTLTELHLSVPSSEQERGLKLTLPNLKKMYLEIHGSVGPGFLGKLKDSLEELHLTNTDGYEPDGMEEEGSSDDGEIQNIPEEDRWSLEVYKFWRSPEKSNIWTYFPKLRFLKTKTMSIGERVVWYSATRRQWKLFNGFGN